MSFETCGVDAGGKIRGGLHMLGQGRGTRDRVFSENGRPKM